MSTLDEREPRVTEDSLSDAELRTAAVTGLRWTMIARPIVEVAMLGSMVVLARLVSPAEFGRYAVALVALELISIPAQGVGVALVQRSHATREHVEASMALALIVGLLLVALTFATAAILVDPIFGSRTAALVRLTAPASLLTSASIVPSALLQRGLEFGRLSVIDVATTIVRAVASISLALAGMNASALVLGGLASTVVGAGLMWWWAPAPWPRLRRAQAKELLSYGVPAALAAMSWVGFRNCDYAIVGARLGALPAGLYFRAYTLGVEYQKKISLVMSSVGFPVLARTQSSDDMDAMRVRMVRLLTLVLFPLLVLLAIVAPVFVPWLFGRPWAPAVVPTQILAAGGAATLVIDAVGTTLMAAGRPRALLAFGWSHFVTYAVVVFVVAPMGLTAVAVAAAVVHTLFLFVAYVLLFRGSALRALGSLRRDIMPAGVSCLALTAVAVPASVALRALPTPPLAYLATMGAIGGATYLFTLRAWFAASWRTLVTVGRHVLPGRNVLSRAVRPLRAAETQSAG